MGICDCEIWKCSSCGFQFEAHSGLYEADPNDFGTTHIIDPYYCPSCGNVKNLSKCISLEPPEKGNEELCHNDSDICEICNTKMEHLKKGKLYKIPFLAKKYKCPKCKQIKFKFKSYDGEIWT